MTLKSTTVTVLLLFTLSLPLMQTARPHFHGGCLYDYRQPSAPYRGKSRPPFPSAVPHTLLALSLGLPGVTSTVWLPAQGDRSRRCSNSDSQLGAPGPVLLQVASVILVVCLVYNLVTSMLLLHSNWQRWASKVGIFPLIVSLYKAKESIS